MCLIALGLLTLGCQQHTEQETYESDYLLDSEFMKVSNFIALESNDDYLISKVSKILIHNDRIFILDKTQGRMFIFNRQGNFINSIESLGQGPQELKIFTDFYIDYEEQELHISSNVERQKIVADFNGKVNRKESLNGHYWQEISQQNDQYYIYRTEMAGPNSEVGLSKIKTGNNIEPLIYNVAGRDIVNIMSYPSVTNSTRGIGYLVPPTSYSNEFKLVFHSKDKNRSKSIYEDHIEPNEVVIFPFISERFQTVMVMPGPDAEVSSLNSFRTIYGKDGSWFVGSYAINDIYNHPSQMMTVTENEELVSVHHMDQIYDHKSADFYRENIIEKNGIQSSKDKEATDAFNKLIEKQGPLGNPIITIFEVIE